MSTATLRHPVTTHAHPRVHSLLLGRTRFYCIQPNCDGKHHVWCGCDR